jgi:hypothetical protein
MSLGERLYKEQSISKRPYSPLAHDGCSVTYTASYFVYGLIRKEDSNELINILRL